MIVKVLNLSYLEIDESFLNIFKENLKRFFPQEENKKESYVLFILKGDKGKVIFYKTKKVLFELKDEKIFEKILENLKDLLIPDYYKKYDYAIGADEAGKGDTFGGLVVACAALNKDIFLSFLSLSISDSKLLKKKNIFEILKKIKYINFPYKIKYLNPFLYNSFFEKEKNSLIILDNLYKTLFMDFFEKYKKLFESKKVLVTLDAYRLPKKLKEIFIPFFEKIEKKYKINITFRAIPKAEKYLEVALASVLAKGAFLVEIEKLKKEFKLSFLPLGSSHKKIKEILSSFEKDKLKYIAKLHFSNVSKFLTDKKIGI